MKFHFFGGPAHLDVMEFERESVAPRISLVVSGSEEKEKINVQLAQLGVSPPFGTFIAEYFFLTTWDDDVLYVFLYSTGEVPTED